MIMSDGVEILITSFIIVCISLILFDILQVFRMRYRERKIRALVSDPDSISAFLNHPNKLKNEANILAFGRCLENEQHTDQAAFSSHVTRASEVLSTLICDRKFKDSIIKSYMVYLATRYGLFFQTQKRDIKQELLYMVTDKDIYIRENALCCVYSIGDAQFVLTALKTLDCSNIHHNEKLLHDGLLKFSGDLDELSDLLLSKFDDFSLEMQKMLTIFTRFVSSKNAEYVLSLLQDETKDRELRLSALRFFLRYPCDAAYPVIVSYAENSGDFWEYRAVAATCLGSYPCEQTVQLLKKLTTDPFWYVRKNAAEALVRLNCDEQSLQDILSGDDRYAKEQAQYVIARKALCMSEGAAK